MRHRLVALLTLSGLATVALVAGLTSAAEARTCLDPRPTSTVDQVMGAAAYWQNNLGAGNTYSGSVRWGDGTSSPISGGRVTHVYKSPGRYDMTMTGSGTLAAAGSSVPCADDNVPLAVVVVHDVRPIVRVTEQHTSRGGKPAVAVTFDARGSVGRDLITRYQWKFDAGGTAAGVRTTKVVARPTSGPARPVRVTLTVSTRYGSVKREARALVEPGGSTAHGTPTWWLAVVAIVVFVIAIAIATVVLRRRREDRDHATVGVPEPEL